MLRLLRKAVPVLIEKQPSLPAKEKTLQRIQRSSWLYWYDPIDLVKTILPASALVGRMHSESEQMKMNPERIHGHGRIDIIFKWEFDEEHDKIADLENRYYVKRYFTLDYARMLPVRLLQPTRGELEVFTFRP